jgi:hypothetical protein
MVLGQSDGAPALQRSAAEILAAAAAIGDSAFAQALLRRVVEAMAGTANPVRCRLLRMLGCTHVEATRSSSALRQESRW